ncbi:hypothetical protein [Streptomyces sp. NPDC001250]|uniref:hypothetical protein n=1 Tax=unclassified Streptomyces TaxID=2593676 RepID=UPI00332E2089
MRNQRALVAACAAVAVLGLAPPVAVADGMGDGGGPSSGSAGFGNGGGLSNGGTPGGDPGSGGLSSNFNFDGHFNDNDNDDDNSNGNGNRGFGDDGRDAGRGDDNGNADRNADNRNAGSGNAGSGGELGGRGDGGAMHIVAAPGVIASGARLTVTVDGCQGGTISSRAFPTTRLNPLREDVSRARARIDSDARPGRYDVTAHCDGRSLLRPAAFTVLGGVQGGFGGGITSGATRADMAIGAGLVAWAVVGGGMYWLRRRKEKRF